jgi:hypothetical protein
MNYRVLTQTSAGSRVAPALDGPFPPRIRVARLPDVACPAPQRLILHFVGENDSDVLGTCVSCFGRVDGPAGVSMDAS